MSCRRITTTERLLDAFTAAVFDLGDRAHVSVCEVVFPEDAFQRTTIEVDFIARGRLELGEAQRSTRR